MHGNEYPEIRTSPREDFIAEAVASSSEKSPEDCLRDVLTPFLSEENPAILKDPKAEKLKKAIPLAKSYFGGADMSPEILEGLRSLFKFAAVSVDLELNRVSRVYAAKKSILESDSAIVDSNVDLTDIKQEIEDFQRDIQSAYIGNRYVDIDNKKLQLEDYKADFISKMRDFRSAGSFLDKLGHTEVARKSLGEGNL